MRRMTEPHPTDRHVGNRIRLRRMGLGMTQSELAAALGLTFQQIQKYEKGINRIGAGRLGRLAEVLKVDPAFFFEDQGGQMPHIASPPDYLTEFLATSEALVLIKAFQKLPTTALRRRVVALVQQLGDRED